MKRRTFIATGTAAAVGTLSGCVTDEIERNFLGETVPFQTVEEAYSMWEEGETRFVDARGRTQYREARITDAYLSPADDGLPENDPVDNWPQEEQIVTYCTCPYQLAGRRAATLISQGHTNVWGLDNGFRTWMEEYPTAVSYGRSGNASAGAMPSYEVTGMADPAHVGEYVWIRHPETGQRELAPIASDGTYAMTLHFYHLTPSSRLEVEAPGYQLEATLDELTTTTVSPDRL